MKLYSENENYKLYQGNMLNMLEVIVPNSIDSVICDPPYELNFMGKGWDNSGIAFQPDTWKKCYEVLKPGGYLLAFGGSRTFHRIACAIEDAGFEIRDIIMWIYGMGFPKSMDISKSLDKRNGKLETQGTGFSFAGNDGRKSELKQNLKFRSDYGYKYEPSTDLAKKWQGWGTALKPSYEPIIVARKPFKGSLVDNVIEYGVGGINIDECRVGTNDKLSIHSTSKNTEQNDMYKWSKERKTFTRPEQNLGRFPANTILTYDETDFDEVCGGFPNTKGFYRPNCKDKSYNQSSNIQLGGGNVSSQYNDSGSASRYFYCAKASKKDRDDGLDEFEEKQLYYDDRRGNSFDIFVKRDENGKPLNPPRKNTHPTVKPTELMQYLVRLVSPNGATILDPFNGSGSTGKAVMYENKERNKNYKYIGIELTEEYLPISKARIEYVCNLKEEVKERQTSLFDD